MGMLGNFFYILKTKTIIIFLIKRELNRGLMNNSSGLGVAEMVQRNKARALKDI